MAERRPGPARALNNCMGCLSDLEDVLDLVLPSGRVHGHVHELVQLVVDLVGAAGQVADQRLRVAAEQFALLAARILVRRQRARRHDRQQVRVHDRLQLDGKTAEGDNGAKDDFECQR